MATTDVERLVVSLEASITKYERAMQRAVGETNKTSRRIESRFAAMNKRVSAGFVGLQRGIGAAFAGVAAVRGATQLIDSATRIENSLKVAGLAGEELDRVYQQLYQSAQRNAAPIESLATLYGRLAIVQNELGASTNEMLSFTDNVAVALRVAGTDAQSASGALLQLSQAMGSGVVRAEEFNSILEGALPIAQATAAGLKEAGGSVARLRQLVVEGKVSSEAFFRAFEAGSVILTEKVANAELTVSQQFVRLQNVLIDTAGKFDDATGAGKLLGDGIEDLARQAQDFGDWIQQNAGGIEQFIYRIGNALDAVQQSGEDFGRATGLSNIGRWVEDITGLPVSLDYAAEGLTRAEREAANLEAQIADTMQRIADFAVALMANENLRLFSPELAADVQDIIMKLEAGALEAGEAQQALSDLAAQNVNFAPQIGQIDGLIAQLVDLEAQARRAAAATSGAGKTRPWRQEEIYGSPIPPTSGVEVSNPVSIETYPVKPLGSGGSGGSASAPADAYQRALDMQRERLRQLEMEAALAHQAMLANNDFGFSVERLRAQMELENAAAEAGLAITPQRRAEIDQLAESYARATANAEAMATAQGLAQQAFDDLAQAGRSALDTIIDGFMEGRDAGDLFNSVLKDLARSLISIGLNSLSGGLQAGGFNPLGFLGGLFGFERGGYTGAGGKHQPAGVVHKGEYVFSKAATQRAGVGNLDAMHQSLKGYANGGAVAMPSIPSLPTRADRAVIDVKISVDESGNIVPVVRQLAGAEADVRISRTLPAAMATTLAQANKTAPAAMAKYQTERFGRDYRTM